jgi:hypothetical protein
MMAEQAKNKGKSASNVEKLRPVLKPGANKQVSNRMAEARQVKANKARAMETGSPEDVAKLLIVRKAK